MCHYLLPQNHTIKQLGNSINEYRYGENALNSLFLKMSTLHPIDEFEIALFGGSNMYISMTKPSIGDLNVACAHNWAKRNNINFKQEDTLGNVGRSINLNLINGRIEVHKYPVEAKEE
jgi:chemotaxis protein CheD